MQFDYNLFIHGPIPSTAMQGYYNLNLVALSYLVAFLGSYVTLDLTGRILDKESSRQTILFWIIACSVMMGCSIWCMHFIGMLAYIMPMPMSYNPFWTFFSLLIAIIGSLAAFSFIKSESNSLYKLILSGIFMGLCIASMHYIGMEAMESEHMPKILYIPWIFFLSIGIAIVVSIAAIWLLLKSNQGSIQRQFQLKIFSALVMAAAICSMHYTGMAAAIFIPHPDHNVMHSTIYSYKMEYYVASILGLMFFISLITSTQRQLTINALQKNQATII